MAASIGHILIFMFISIVSYSVISYIILEGKNCTISPLNIIKMDCKKTC